MLLVIDIGNTNTVLGVYDGNELKAHFRIETKKECTADELWIFFKEFLKDVLPEKISHVAIANVVPSLSLAFQEMSRHYLGKIPFAVDQNVKLPIRIKVDFPKEVGADRIVNAAAAYSQHKTDLVVIDFGTATTFDYVTKDGDYCGGLICPGIRISLEALFQRTSKLPRVEIVKTQNVIGKNTIDCMQSGIFYGYLGLVDSIIARMEEETGKKLKVIATGGLAHLLAEESKHIEEVDDLLTLKGLKILFELNHK